jgi:hypothetical protein
VITLMIIMLHEAFDLTFQVTRQEVVFQQYSVLKRLMPPLDFALGLRMIGRASDMAHVVVFDIIGQLAGDVARAVVRQKPRFMDDVGLITARGYQSHVERLSDITRLHRRAKLPTDDVAREVVQYR